MVTLRWCTHEWSGLLWAVCTLQSLWTSLYALNSKIHKSFFSGSSLPVLATAIFFLLSLVWILPVIATEMAFLASSVWVLSVLATEMAFLASLVWVLPVLATKIDMLINPSKKARIIEHSVHLDLIVSYRVVASWFGFKAVVTSWFGFEAVAFSSFSSTPNLFSTWSGFDFPKNSDVSLSWSKFPRKKRLLLVSKKWGSTNTGRMRNTSNDTARID